MTALSKAGQVTAGGVLAALLATAAFIAVGPADADARHRGRVGFTSYRYGYGGAFCYPRYVHAYPRIYRHLPYSYSYSYPYYGHPSFYAHPRRFSVSFTLANAPPAGHYYFDPYCDRRFSRLNLYVRHLHGYSHPRLVHVIAFGSGYPAYTYRYRGGHWMHGD